MQVDPIQKLERDLKQVNIQVRKLNTDIQKQLKERQMLALPDLNNTNAEKHQKTWTKQEAEAFMLLFKLKYPHNPFVNASRHLPNQTYLFLADDKIHHTHVQQLLVALVAFGRYVHVNTGTHGRPDGSTIFWKSADTVKWLQDDKHRKEWINGSQDFVNQDLKIITDTCAHIQDEQQVSARFVASDVYPTYPVYCDVVNAWCWSQASPRCPVKLLESFKFYLKKEELIENYENRQQEILKNLTDEAFKFQSNAKELLTDNMFVVLRDCLKILGIPEDGLAFFTTYFKKCWNQEHSVEIEPEEIAIDDGRFNQIVINRIIKFSMEFLVYFYRGNAQEFINKYDEIKFNMVTDEFSTNTRDNLQRKKRKPPKRKIFRNKKKGNKSNLKVQNEDSNQMENSQGFNVMENNNNDLMKMNNFEREVHNQIEEQKDEEEYQQVERKKMVIPEGSTKDLIMEVVKADQNTLVKDYKLIITQEDYNDQEQEGINYYQKMTGNKSVWLGRALNQLEPHIQISNHNSISRNHILITYDKDSYWIQDLKTQNPISIVISSDNPLKLSQGMMIKTGEDVQSFLKVTQISTEDRQFFVQTHKGEPLHQFFTQKNSKAEFGTYKRQHYLKILDELNKPVAECYPQEGNEDQMVWHVVSKGFNYQAAKFDINHTCFISNGEELGHWADIYYEKGIGWYMKATKEGENSKSCLKVALKDNDEIYSDGTRDSQPILIQENMKFGIGIWLDYVIQCTTRIRELELT